MGKRVEYTPQSIIVSAVRRLWLRSRERSKALKNADYRCENCGDKQSKVKGKEVKLEVHHPFGINWKRIIEVVREELLQTPDRLQVLCKPCHLKEHAKETE